MGKIALKKTINISRVSEEKNLLGNKHTQLGMAILEGLKEILRGNISVIRKQHLKTDISKLIE